MGATNHTTNYNLSQFIGTDKPSWLNDYNGDMSNIDLAIKQAADDASAASTLATNASSTATSAANTANSLSTQINAPVTGLAAVVTSQGSAITNIDTTIGTTPLTTLAQTLTGAIEEVKASIPSVTGALILEGTYNINVPFDGNTTIAQGMLAVYTDLVSVFSTLQSDEYIKIVSTKGNPNLGAIIPADQSLLQTVPGTVYAATNMIDPTNAQMRTCQFGPSGDNYFRVWVSTGGGTITDHSSTTPSGGNCTLTYEKYKKLA